MSDNNYLQRASDAIGYVIETIKNKETGYKVRAIINGAFHNLKKDLDSRPEMKDIARLKTPYFKTLSELQNARPDATAGDKAWVGEPFPGMVWYFTNANKWENTGKVPPAEEVDLTNYAKRTDLDHFDSLGSTLEKYLNTDNEIQVTIEETGRYISTSGETKDSTLGNNIYSFSAEPGESYFVTVYTGGINVAAISAWKDGNFMHTIRNGTGSSTEFGKVVHEVIVKEADTIKLSAGAYSVIKKNTGLKKDVDANFKNIMAVSDKVVEQDRVKNEIAGVYEKSHNDSILTYKNQNIKSDTGLNDVSQTTDRTPYISVEADKKIEFPIVKTNTVNGAAFYDSQKEYISGVAITDSLKEWDIVKMKTPENAAFIRTTYWNEENRIAKVAPRFYLKTETSVLQKGRLNVIEEDIVQLVPYPTTRGSFSNPDATTYNISDYYRVGEGDIIDYMTRVSSSSAVVIWDAEFNEISRGKQVSGANTFSERYVVPRDAAYFKIIAMNESHNNYEKYDFSCVIKRNKNKDNLKLQFGAIPYSDPITGIRETYPTLKFVKISNVDNNQHPYAMLWGYVTNDENPKILISKGVADRLEYLCDWNKDIAWGTNPSWYTMYMTPTGDILCVYNVGRNQNAPDSQRRNPIVYPAGDYSNPILVELEGDKPTIWQRVGIDYVIDEYGDIIITFAEYTRPNSPECKVWKIKGDIKNPANWRVVKRFEVDPSSIGFKHCHLVQRDPFSGNIYLTTGDSDIAAAIYVSTDNAETYELLHGPDEATCRMSNIIYLEDYIYWATDSGVANKHKVFRAKRGIDGILDPSSIKVLADIPRNSGSNATYCTCYDEHNNRLLLLDYLDNTNTYIDIYAYNITTGLLETVAHIDSVDGTALNMGFRCSAVSFYQNKNEKRFIVGFQQLYPNNMRLLGNKTGADIDRVCNMTLELK